MPVFANTFLFSFKQARMTTENTLLQSLSAISEWRAFVHYHTWLGIRHGTYSFRQRQRSMVL